MTYKKHVPELSDPLCRKQNYSDAVPGNRQSRDKDDSIVALLQDFQKLAGPMLLQGPRAGLRGRLHSSPPAWLSTQLTGLATLKRARFIRLSQDIWKRSSPDSASGTGKCLRSFEREFRSFIDCGVLARGFIRVHCDDCGLDRFVPYSCKKRGFCNSCGGRRMSDTAAHLVDRVLPHVPVRQWVLSFPHAIRYRLAYDAGMVTDVLGIFTKTIFASLIRPSPRIRRRAESTVWRRYVHTALRSALNLNLHLHTLVTMS
jgi:hypothetical protein